MTSSMDLRSLEAKTAIWKARAQAKQKWLERALAEKAGSPQEAARRKAWISRALKMVKRARTRIEYETSLVDAYAQHLSALEMTLMSEAEKIQSGTPKVGSVPEPT